MSVVTELRRRNVFRVAAAYAVTAWLIIQVAETVLPVYGFPDTAVRYVITALAIGLLPALVFAWVFELTPEGLQRESRVDRSRSITARTGRKLDGAIIVILAVAVGYFAFDKFILAGSRQAALMETARQEGRSGAIIGEYGDRSIAVLPFEDMSPERDQEYMSDGIAEEILNLLAQVRELRVISRSSAFSFKGKGVALPAIAEQLNVAYVLEGSVRKSGDQIRITAQLIEARSDSHRWSETYDRKLENVFDIQDEIAAHVATELAALLTRDSPKSERLNVEAYPLVMEARYLWHRRAQGDEEKALELYRRAVELDPGSVAAWTGLSAAYTVATSKGRIDRAEGRDLAKRAVNRALELDPGNAEARVRLGLTYWADKDYVAARDEFVLAKDLAPYNTLVLGSLAMVATAQGRIDDAVDYFDQAASIDPMAAIWPNNMSTWLIQFHRVDEAEAAARRSFELNGNVQTFHNKMTDIHFLRGEYEQALESLDYLPDDADGKARRAIVLDRLGRGDEAENLISELKETANARSAFDIARVYAARGDADRAFEWLAKVDGYTPWVIAYETYTRFLRSDPRWEPYVDGLDWPWEHEP